MARRLATLLFLFSLGIGVTTAQEFGPGAPGLLAANHPNWPVAKPEDVSSAANIVAAYYDVLSGRADTPRDWQRFRSLFHPDARYVFVNHWKPKHSVANMTDLDTIIGRWTTNLAKADLYEQSIENKTETFNNIVNVWSAYETRRHTADTVPILRGVNNFQIENDGDRYWIIQIISESE
jgi:hypothetical protein